jgi:hypothetical protein
MLPRTSAALCTLHSCNRPELTGKVRCYFAAITIMELRFTPVDQRWRNLSCLGILACRGEWAVLRGLAYRPSALEGQKIRLHRGASTAITTRGHAFAAKAERSTHVAFREIR